MCDKKIPMATSVSMVGIALSAIIVLTSCGASDAATVAYWDLDSDGIDLEGTGGSGGTGQHLVLTNPGGSPAHQTKTLVDPVPNPDTVADASNNGSLRTFNSAYRTGTDFDDYGAFRFNNDASFTFETWFEKFDGSDTQYIASTRGSNIGGGNFQGWELKIQGGGDDLNVFINGSSSGAGSLNLTVPNVISNQTAYHLAFVWDHLANSGDGQVSLYLDGALIGSAAGDPGWSFARGGTLSLGARESDGDSMWDENPLNGWLDEVRFSDMALSPSQFLNVPEPASVSLVVLASLGALAVGRRRSF